MDFSPLLLLILLLGMIFSPIQSDAGDAKGNGGGALLCPGQDLEILDYHEAKLLGFGEPNLSDQDNFVEMANEYLARLRVISPVRAQMYKTRLDSFVNEAVFLDSIPIGEIDDLGVVLPPECEWRQIVNQNPLLLPSGKNYLIDRILWNKLSSMQRVGLIFHEILYRESCSRTSQGIRRLNGLLVTKKMNDLNLAERILALKAAGLGWAEAQGLTFLLDRDVELDSNGNTLLRATAVEESTFVWKEQIVQLRSDVVQFYKNGRLKSIRLRSHLLIPFLGKTLELETWEYNRSLLQFHENGEFKEGPLDFQKTWRLSNSNLNLEFKYISFDEAGQLRSVAQAHGIINLDQNILIDSEVLFYPNGGLRSFVWGSRRPLKIWDDQEVFPRYGTVVNFSPNLLPQVSPSDILNLGETGPIQDIITDKDGRLKNWNQEWITFKAGDLIHLRP